MLVHILLIYFSDYYCTNGTCIEIQILTQLLEYIYILFFINFGFVKHFNNLTVKSGIFYTSIYKWNIKLISLDYTDVVSHLSLLKDLDLNLESSSWRKTQFIVRSLSLIFLSLYCKILYYLPRLYNDTYEDYFKFRHTP